MQSKARIAIAIKIMLDEANLPAAMHCTHGKDRTGIIVMLLLLLCNVATEVCSPPGVPLDQAIRLYSRLLLVCTFPH